MPSLIGATKEIMRTSTKRISAELGFKLYDTFGLDEAMIIKLAACLNLEFDLHGFKNEMRNAKMRSQRMGSMNENRILEELLSDMPKTDDSFKYDYKKLGSDYAFKNLEVNILKIIQDNRFVVVVKPFTECYLLLDKTNFYCEAGGQVSDSGKIVFESGIFEITDVVSFSGKILHKGLFTNSGNHQLVEGVKGIIKIDEQKRMDNMRNHTATHLLNEVLKFKKGATCQKSSKVLEKYLNFNVAIFGNKLNLEEIESIEFKIKEIINAGADVVAREVDLHKFMSYDKVTIIPGEIYPDNSLRVIEVQCEDFVSR